MDLDVLVDIRKGKQRNAFRHWTKLHTGTPGPVTYGTTIIGPK